MFEFYNGSQFLPESPEPDQRRDDRALETTTRYGAYFCLGVAVTLLARTIPALTAIYWTVAIVGLVALAIAVHLTRRVQLLAVAAIVVASLLAGHLDGLHHGASQAITEIEGRILR